MNGIISMSAVYGIAAILSLILAVCCWLLFKKKEIWLLLVHGSVLVVNAGYFLLAVSGSLQQALMANRIAYRIAYLRSVCLLILRQWPE